MLKFINIIFLYSNSVLIFKFIFKIFYTLFKCTTIQIFLKNFISIANIYVNFIRHIFSQKHLFTQILLLIKREETKKMRVNKFLSYF